MIRKLGLSSDLHIPVIRLLLFTAVYKYRLRSCCMSVLDEG